MSNLSERWQQLLRQARILLLRGIFVVPIPPREKAPRIKGWTELRLEVEELKDAFGPNDNVGVILGAPSGGLIDVDLDCPEALAAARFFLPRTDRISGRDSNPESHHFYICAPCPASMKLTDLDGTVLLELRSTGLQTLIPPSIHPSGEEIFWTRAKQPARVEPRELEQAVRGVAAATLLARHWPMKGSRHEMVLALSGFLLRNGWSPEEVENFVTAAAFASMTDEEWRSRRHDVKSSLNRIVKGKPATGIPKLASLVGGEVVSRLMEWLEISPRISASLRQQISVAWPEPPRPEAYHGLAGEIVAMIEPHSESDPMALLSQFLVGFGSMVGPKPYFPVEGNKHSAHLFAVLVGQTSRARKGSALSQVMRPLREADTDWADTCVLSGLSSGEGLIWEVRDPIYSKDEEKILDVGVVDKRRLAVEPEFAQPLKLMARESNILSTVVRQAWDSGDLRILTKNCPAQATGAHIAILGHITLHELRKHLSETELANGFANRFLWLLVRRSKVLPEGGRLDKEDFSELVERLTATVRWARKVKKMSRSEKARNLWELLYKTLTEDKPGLMGAVISRAEAQVTRLSVIYALLDRSPIIRTHHIKAALAFWEYAEASARLIFGDSLGDPTADEIIRALRASSSGLTRTEISNVFGGHRRSADISRALVVLAQSGLATCRPESTGGRPDERWFVLTEVAKNAKKD